MSNFNTVKKVIRDRFDAFVKSGKPLFVTDTGRDEIWEAYFDNFSEENRQEHNCSSCRAFIRQVGNIVMINDDLTISTLWGEHGRKLFDGKCGDYIASFAQLDKYIRSRPIRNKFYHTDATAGTDKSPDPKLGVVWEHFFVKIPSNLRRVPDNEFRTTVAVFERGLKEITPDAIQTVKELIDQGSLYRGNTYSTQIDEFQGMQNEYNQLEQNPYFAWRTAASMSEASARLRNTAIGQLLQALSEGKDLESSVKAFETMVAPANYKRPTALITPRMIETAKQRLDELGLISALDRRRLDTRDLSVADALFTHRSTTGAKDVFAEMAGETPVDVKKLSKVEEVGVEKFIKDILPTTKSIRVLLESAHLGNLVTLTGAQDPDANPLFNWDNSFGWSYTGGVADSIKEKVKSAGGRVDGWGRFSLSWFNTDDLDIHFRGGGEHVSFNSKSGIQARLDVDMNVTSLVRDAVENIFIPRQLKPGDYEIWVNNYTRRESSDTGFEIEAEINGQVYHFSTPKSPANGNNSNAINFRVDQSGNVVFAPNKFASSVNGKTKWGLKTGIWHQVNAITTSPNHWTKPTGNKHLFFLLAGCVSDEETRPFYNEFLTPALAKERKVMEVLGGKVEVAPAEGAELSGLGFSDTIRNSMYVEIEGSFKRTIKIKF